MYPLLPLLHSDADRFYLRDVVGLDESRVSISADSYGRAVLDEDDREVQELRSTPEALPASVTRYRDGGPTITVEVIADGDFTSRGANAPVRQRGRVGTRLVSPSDASSRVVVSYSTVVPSGTPNRSRLRESRSLRRETG